MLAQSYFFVYCVATYIVSTKADVFDPLNELLKGIGIGG